MIRNVFLDLDDTVLDFQKGERLAIAYALRDFGIEPTESCIDRYIEINLACWRALERGEMTKDQVLIGRFERLFSELKLDLSADKVQQVYEEYLAKEHDLIEGAEELLRELGRNKKYRLYMATNGIPSVQKPRIRDAKIGGFFDGIFISEEIGYAKPDARFFEGCFKKIENFRPEESIIVGDSLTSDIKGGLNAGILTCHFNRRNIKYGDIRPHYEIKSLDELIPLLDGIE